MFALDYRDARPIYIQICDGIREQILAGILNEGDRLSSVRELATELTINPNTIQRSYGILEQEGCIISVPGKGNFVNKIPSIADARQKELWAELDDLRKRMEHAGICAEDIIRYLLRGGNENA